MENQENKDLNNFIVIGDRVLIKPLKAAEKTKSGLYLPPTVKEKEQVQRGYVVKAGPGFAIPAVHDDDEPWKKKSDTVQYVPLQAQEGDLAIYLQNSGYDIEINSIKYIIVPHNAILMLERDQSLFA